jgi:hypothetical protein
MGIRNSDDPCECTKEIIAFWFGDEAMNYVLTVDWNKNKGPTKK